MGVQAAMPDLTVNEARLAASVTVETRTFGAGDCSVVEGCAPAGSRKLLLFDTGFINIGDADLIIGAPTSRPDLFEYSPCHGHYHMHGMADYEVLSPSGETVLRARKQGFCLRDNLPYDPAAGPAKYNCDNQGLTVGWEDVYDKSLDCQWLDITGLAGGDYVLKVSVNPETVFAESDHSNNWATVAFTLPGDVNTNEVCKVKAYGLGSIVTETQKCFHFKFKAHSNNGELKGFLRAFDEASGVCITSTNVANVTQMDDQTVSIDYNVIFGTNQPGTLNIVVRDGKSSSECDSIEVTLEQGVSISGTLGAGCDGWGHVKVKAACKERCKGGVDCKGHPYCDEHPYCKGKRCRGHKDCGDDDDEDCDDHGDDDDGEHDCEGHPECKPKCQGGKFCPGHPKCDEHPFCEVPNCKGHKGCKDQKCKGHPECRKNHKHENWCKAKFNAKQPCSCKDKKGNGNAYGKGKDNGNGKAKGKANGKNKGKSKGKGNKGKK